MDRIIKKNQRGATAILLTLILLSGMLFIALTASDIIQNGLQMSKAHINSTKAYFGAEAGAERVLWEIRKNSHDPVLDTWTDGECVQYTAFPTGNIAPTATDTCPPYSDAERQQLGNNAIYWIRYNFDGTVVKFTCMGNYNNITQRAVEVAYVD